MALIVSMGVPASRSVKGSEAAAPADVDEDIKPLPYGACIDALWQIYGLQLFQFHGRANSSTEYDADRHPISANYRWGYGGEKCSEVKCEGLGVRLPVDFT